MSNATAPQALIDEATENLFCSARLEHGRDDFHRKTAESLGWGDSQEVTELVATEFGHWGRPNNRKPIFGISFGVYEITPIVSNNRFQKWGAEIVRPRLVTRLVVTDSEGKHTLERDLPPQSVVEDGWVTLDLCGVYGEWVAVHAWMQGFCLRALWSGDEVSPDWWTSFVWMRAGLGRAGVDYVRATGL